jgi:hypothetical protein
VNQFVRKWCVAALFLFLYCEACLAQQVPDPAPLKSTGTIPAEFITLSADKYRKDIARKGDTSRVLRKNERDHFYLESNFLISDIFRSGKVLFNDTLGNYLNRIADRLLSSDPALRNQVRIYVIMSEIPNAFTGDNGAIFMSIGLIALCENEAQLAFVLAHEIAHFRNRHVIRQYINDVTLEHETDDIDVEDRLLLKSNHSREQESQADAEGMRMMVNAGYPVSECVHALRLLGQVHLPFISDTAFMPEMLSIGAFHFQNFTLDTAAISLARTNGDFTEDADEYATHPAIPERCAKLLQLASGMNADTTLRYPASGYFIKQQRIARYELCRLYLLSGYYQSAIYAAAVLKTVYPDSPGLDAVIAKALYGYSMHNISRRDGNRELEECGEETSRVKVFLNSFSYPELMLLSLSWNIHCYGSSGEPAFYYRSLDLVTVTHQRYDELFSLDSGADTISWLGTDSSATVEMCVEECFRMNQLAEASDVFKGYNGKLYSEPRYNWDDTNDGEHALGVDTLIVLDPFYYRFQPIRKGEVEYRFIASEKGMVKFTRYISNCGEAADMQLHMLSPYAMDSMATDTFNDMALLKSYFEARSDHHDSGLVSVDAERIDSLCKKYNTEQVAIMGEFSVHTHRKKVGLIIASIILWPTLPFGIAYAVSPTYDSFNYVSVYDIPSGQRYENIHYTRQRDSRAGVSSSLFYNLLQIRNKR